jgi:proline iminopeptidase
MEIDGLHVEVVGDGVPTLVLHGGLGVDHTLYRASLEPLADELQLIYLDHRGNGRSARPDPATLTMAGWADDALHAGRAVAGNAPLNVIGHSYGGFVAQELAIRHPQAVGALVLICTTPGQLGTGEEPARPGPPMPEEFAALLSSLPETDDEVAAGMSALAAAYLHRADPDVLRDLMADTTFSATAMRRGFEVLAEWSSVDRLGAILAPTLILAGRHDHFTSWPQADRIAAGVPGAEVVVFEDSAHFPWLEEPELFFTTLRDWLRRRDGT